MRSFLNVCVICFLLTACTTVSQNNTSGSPSPKISSYPQNYQELARNWLLARLKDPYSAEIVGISAPEPHNYWAGLIYGGLLRGYQVCITYNAKNSFGAYVGFKTNCIFIYNDRIF